MKEELYAGYGATDITPSSNSFCSFRLSPTKRCLGVHDPLRVQALLLLSKNSGLLLVSAEVVGISSDLARTLRMTVSQAIDLPTHNILLAATHTHNGPEVLGEEPLDCSGQVDLLNIAVISAAKKAKETIFPARMGWGRTVAHNGKNRFQARIGGPVDRIDPRIDFLRIDDRNGQHRGVLWHYAAHPTAAMGCEYLISGDYCALANSRISHRTGGFAMFFNGACGNVNLELTDRSFSKAEKHAEELSELVSNELAVTRTAGSADLHSIEQPLVLPLTPALPDLQPEVAKDEILSYYADMPHKTPDPEEYPRLFIEYNRLRQEWWKHKLIEEASKDHLDNLPVQAHRIGSHLVLSLPGELFVEFQMQIQQKMQEERIMIFGYSNGFVGYIPDETAFSVTSYETSPSYFHRFGPAAANEITEAGWRLLARLPEKRE